MPITDLVSSFHSLLIFATASTGSIIWIPQLYIHCILKSGHRIVGFYICFKSIRMFEQIVCIAYFLYNGLFWLVAKHHPAAIAGQLVDALVCLAVILQVIWYEKNKRSDVVSNKPCQVAGDTKLLDQVTLCEPNLRACKTSVSMHLEESASSV